MNTFRFWLPVAAALSTCVIGCSGSDDTGSDKNPSTNHSGTGGSGGSSTDTCDPNGAIPCVAGLAEPCAGIDSGFDGDAYCLAPPDPEVGYQLHVGPSDYSDPAQTDKYLIQPGDETNWAEVGRTPNDVTVYSGQYISHMRPGSHHFILFGIKDSDVPAQMGPGSMTGSGTESAVGALGGQFLAGATRQVQDAMSNSEYPEDQGIATETPPHRAVAMNIHWINTTDHPLLQELWVNFTTMPLSDVKHWAHPITWYGGLGMNIPPGQHVTLNSTGCAAPTGQGQVRVLGMTGHVHASTLQYNATMQRGGESTVLFQDYDWHEPTEFRYNRATENGTPDAASKTKGGFSGVLNIQDSDTFAWQCEIQNRGTTNLTFSNRVYDGEMCNVFGFYMSDSKDAAPWLCAFF